MARPLKIDPSDYSRIYRLYLIDKFPIKAIALAFGVSYLTVWRVLKKKDEVLKK